MKALLLWIGVVVCAGGGLVLIIDLCKSIWLGNMDIGGNFQSATWRDSKLYFLRLVIFKISVIGIAFIYMGVCLQQLGII